MAKVKTLEDLFEAQLHDIYWAEGKLHKALGKMAKKAPDAALSAAFLKHQEETQSQIDRLEQIMESLDIKVKGKKCDAMAGLLEEAEEMMKEASEPAVLNAAMIAAAQKVEHYEIASYGTLVCWANELGYSRQAQILTSILGEEKKTDTALTTLAENGLNVAAESKNVTSMQKASSGKKSAPAKKSASSKKAA